jgi:hypothetical protein
MSSTIEVQDSWWILESTFDGRTAQQCLEAKGTASTWSLLSCLIGLRCWFAADPPQLQVIVTNHAILEHRTKPRAFCPVQEPQYSVHRVAA